jgi:hypothetical protein
MKAKTEIGHPSTRGFDEASGRHKKHKGASTTGASPGLRWDVGLASTRRSGKACLSTNNLPQKETPRFHGASGRRC